MEAPDQGHMDYQEKTTWARIWKEAMAEKQIKLDQEHLGEVLINCFLHKPMSGSSLWSSRFVMCGWIWGLSGTGQDRRVQGAGFPQVTLRYGPTIPKAITMKKAYWRVDWWLEIGVAWF